MALGTRGSHHFKQRPLPKRTQGTHSLNPGKAVAQSARAGREALLPVKRVAKANILCSAAPVHHTHHRTHRLAMCWEGMAQSWAHS